MRPSHAWLTSLLACAASCTPAVDRNDAGAITSGGPIGVFELRVGDCFDDAGVFDGGDTVELARVAGLPCSDPHDNEVYAVFDLEPADFPGDREVADAAFARCLERFSAFVGRDYETSSLAVLPIYPTRESWTRDDDREVVCAVHASDGRKLRGTAGNSDN